MNKLFMLLIGCKPEGRHTEQHDTFFGIAKNVQGLLNDLYNFWPEAKDKLHIDAWREVNYVNGFAVTVIEKNTQSTPAAKLFFLNLGGYKPGDFEEYHYKMLVAGSSKTDAIQAAKQTAFFKHTAFAGVTSHIDDKYGVDVDDAYEIEEILPAAAKEKYKVQLTLTDDINEDELHIGYFKLSSFTK